MPPSHRHHHHRQHPQRQRHEGQPGEALFPSQADDHACDRNDQCHQQEQQRVAEAAVTVTAGGSHGVHQHRDGHEAGGGEDGDAQ